MIRFLGWALLIGLGLYFHIIQSVMLFAAMVLAFVAAFLGGGIISIN
jgi:hypothetical protein|tara:strand:+ start:124 stop:264 length:141 start_codon:yes stop_codon:yes gene_type:complete